MMFVLDTNILSAMMIAPAQREVKEWMARFPAEAFFTTAICQAEILSGLSVMSAGKRRDALMAAAHSLFNEDMKDRILPFDSAAAKAYAGLFALQRQTGRDPGAADIQIAAITLLMDAVLVTRNVRGFENTGIKLVNPWAC